MSLAVFFHVSRPRNQSAPEFHPRVLHSRPHIDTTLTWLDEDRCGVHFKSDVRDVARGHQGSQLCSSWGGIQLKPWQWFMISVGHSGSCYFLWVCLHYSKRPGRVSPFGVYTTAKQWVMNLFTIQLVRKQYESVLISKRVRFLWITTNSNLLMGTNAS